MDVKNILDCKIEKLQNNKENINDIITYLRKTNSPTTDKKMSNKYIRRSGVVYDIDSLYDYYIKFINGILRTIRNYEIDYCFTFGQIKELLRFEPNLKITYDETNYCFEVRL